MAKITMQLEGFQQTQRALTRAPEIAKAYAGDAVATSTFAVGQRAKARVSVRTGDLKRAIVAITTGLSGRVGIAPGGAKGRFPPSVYWRFVEFGTVHMGSAPFMRPAADEEEAQFIANMRAIGSKMERDLSAGRTL